MKFIAFSFVMIVCLVLIVPESGFANIEPVNECNEFKLESYKEFYYLSFADQKEALDWHSYFCRDLATNKRYDPKMLIEEYKKINPVNLAIQRLYCGYPGDKGKEDYAYWKRQARQGQQDVGPPSEVKRICREGGLKSNPQKIKYVTTEVFCWRVKKSHRGGSVAFLEGSMAIESKMDQYRDKVSSLCENVRKGEITLERGYNEYRRANKEMGAYIAGVMAKNAALFVGKTLDSILKGLGILIE